MDGIRCSASGREDKRTALILGTMPGELTLENIYSILLEKTPEVMEKTGSMYI